LGQNQRADKKKQDKMPGTFKDKRKIERDGESQQ